jgi:hypothetical protein
MRPRARHEVRSTQADPARKASETSSRTARACSFYGIGPFGLEPLVLCMMLSSSGDAGTRGEVGAKREDVSLRARPRFRGECFRTGAVTPGLLVDARVIPRQTNLGFRNEPLGAPIHDDLVRM